MASGTTTSTDSVTERVVRVRSGKPRAYRWPELALFLLLFFLFVCATVTLGSFSYFCYVQNRLTVPIPWYYYFIIATAVLTIIFCIAMAVLYSINLLLPIIVMIPAFILAVFWLTGLIKESIDLWGPLGSINDKCVRFVYTNEAWGARTIDTIARLQQEGMCNLWKTSFAMEMIATFLLCWTLLLAWQVMAAARRGY